MLRISHAERKPCQRCSSTLTRDGFVVEDSQGVQHFVCEFHTYEMLRALCRPESTRRWTPPFAGSAEEYAETARVVGYRPGLGSSIDREE